MPIQAIDLNTTTGVTFNGTNVTEVNLNGTTIWPYVATGINVTTAFVPFSGFNVTDGFNNTSANFSVSEIQANASGSVRIYIGHKITTNPTYRNDTPIAAIQVLDSAGTTVLQNWNFSTGSTAGTLGWTTISRNVASTSSQGNLSESPAQAAALTYNGIVYGADVSKFTHASSTPSPVGGAADGIGLSSSPLTLGNGTEPQSANTWYMYREASSSIANSVTFMRSPVITITGGSKVRIAYIMGNDPTPAAMQDVNDTLFLGII